MDSHKVSTILMEDVTLQREWLKFLHSLDYFPTCGEDYLQRLKADGKIYELFCQIIRGWQSAWGKEANLRKLVDVLESKQFNSAAENLKQLILNGPDSSFEIPNVVHNFEGRKVYLDKLSEKLKSNQSPVVLTGIGGIGKTELAKRFVADTQKEFGIAYNYIWLSGSNKRTLHEGLVRLAKTFNNKELWNNITDLMNWIIQQLPTNCTNLFVIDDMDDTNRDVVAVWEELVKSSISYFLLVTAKSRDVLNCRNPENIIVVNELEEEDAKQLLDSSIKDQDIEDINLLCKTFHKFPLLLQQAIGYINSERSRSRRNPNFSIGDYMKLLKKEEITLLSSGLEFAETDYSLVTFMTWNVTWKKN